MAEETFAYLTTTGRKSGNPHTIEIWYVTYGDGCYMVSEFPDKADWVKNIQQQPAVEYAIGTRIEREAGTLPWQAGTGRALNPVADEPLHAQIRALFDAKYDWSEGLIVELRPA